MRRNTIDSCVNSCCVLHWTWLIKATSLEQKKQTQASNRNKESVLLITIVKKVFYSEVKIKYFVSLLVVIPIRIRIYWRKNFRFWRRQMASLDACRTLAAVFLRLV